MKYSATITDEEYQKISAYIDCGQMLNPQQDEFVIVDPTDQFLVVLSLFNIEYHRED